VRQRLRGGSEHALTVPSLSGLGLRSRLRCLQLTPRLRAVRLLVCDFDGVLTDGGLHYTSTGEVSNRNDVHAALLCGGRSAGIEQRPQHLEIDHCLKGVGDMHQALAHLQQQLAVPVSAAAFLGEDLNDLVTRPLANLLLCPAAGFTPSTRQVAARSTAQSQRLISQHPAASPEPARAMPRCPPRNSRPHAERGDRDPRLHQEQLLQLLQPIQP